MNFENNINEGSILQYRKSIEILLFLLFFPFFKPNVFRDLWTEVGTIYNLMRVICTVIILLILLWKHKFPSHFSRYVIYFFIWVIINAAIHKMDVMNAVNQTLVVIPCVLLVDLYSSTPKELIKALYYNVALLMYINLAFVIVYYPLGLYGDIANSYYFLCNRTRFIVYAIPLIVLSGLCIILFGKKANYYISIIVALLNIFWPRSAGSMLVIIAMLGGWIYITKRIRSEHRDSFFILFSMALFLNIVVVFGYPVVLKNPYVVSFLRTVLHRSVTFSGRTIIWENAKKAISENLLLGLGNGYTLPFVGDLTRGAHNQYFDVLLISGIPGLILFFHILIYSVRSKYQKETEVGINNLFYIMLFGFMLNFITESYYWQIFFIMLSLANISAKISECPKGTHNKVVFVWNGKND